MQVLRLVLYDYDALDTDDRIGEARVDVKDLKDQEEKDLWLDVDHHDPKEGNENRYKASSMQLLRSYPHQVPCFCIFTGRVFLHVKPRVRTCAFGFYQTCACAEQPRHRACIPSLTLLGVAYACARGARAAACMVAPILLQAVVQDCQEGNAREGMRAGQNTDAGWVVAAGGGRPGGQDQGQGAGGGWEGGEEAEEEEGQALPHAHQGMRDMLGMHATKMHA